MVAGSEEHGGIERYVDAVKLKSAMFQQALVENDVQNSISRPSRVCARSCRLYAAVSARGLMRIAFVDVREGIVELFDDASTSRTASAVSAVVSRQTRKHRWVSDLAAEMLHNADPERVPLMNRWVWDAKANTGVIREIWHGDNVDHITIPVADGYGTYLMLREELEPVPERNGIFRDVLHYVDVLCAQIYAQYICEQGGSYLRADFSAPEDPMQHTRRLLGLDGVQPGTAELVSSPSMARRFVLDDSTKLN